MEIRAWARPPTGAGRAAIGRPLSVAGPPVAAAKSFVAVGVVDHPDQSLAGDADAPARNPVEEVDRAVEWIDDPATAAAAEHVVALLADDPVVRRVASQQGPDGLLGGDVGLADRVDRAALGLDPEGARVRRADGQLGGGRAGRGLRQRQHRAQFVSSRPPGRRRRRAHGGIVARLRRPGLIRD